MAARQEAKGEGDTHTHTHSSTDAKENAVLERAEPVAVIWNEVDVNGSTRV